MAGQIQHFTKHHYQLLGRLRPAVHGNAALTYPRQQEAYSMPLIHTDTLPAIDKLYGGCFSGKDDWCIFTTAASISMLPDYQL
ncbi:hypothetical protein CJF32_00001977 [Rutstroemia sp. NJR-2017a WRK4]|nr:hypothetical protein CJF32_00001977 [Rutstroemia sp. NJR-2017a WRK4]